MSWPTVPTLHMMGAPGTLTRRLPVFPPCLEPGTSTLGPPLGPAPLCACQLLPTPLSPSPSPPAGVPWQLSVTGGTGCTICILYHFNEGAHCPV